MRDRATADPGKLKRKSEPAVSIIGIFVNVARSGSLHGNRPSHPISPSVAGPIPANLWAPPCDVRPVVWPSGSSIDLPRRRTEGSYCFLGGPKVLAKDGSCHHSPATLGLFRRGLWLQRFGPVLLRRVHPLFRPTLELAQGDGVRLSSCVWLFCVAFSCFFLLVSFFC